MHRCSTHLLFIYANQLGSRGASIRFAFKFTVLKFHIWYIVRYTRFPYWYVWGGDALYSLWSKRFSFPAEDTAGIKKSSPRARARARDSRGRTCGSFFYFTSLFLRPRIVVLPHRRFMFDHDTAFSLDHECCRWNTYTMFYKTLFAILSERRTPLGTFLLSSQLNLCIKLLRQSRSR